MIEDYTAWRFWFDVVQVAGTAAIGLYLWWDRRSKARDKRLTDLEETVVTHHNSIDNLKKSVEPIDAIQKMVGDHDNSVESLEKDEEERKADCKEHHQRTKMLELGIRELPSRDELNTLSKNIGDLTEKLGKLDGRLTGINRAVDLLNQHHLNGESRG